MKVCGDGYTRQLRQFLCRQHDGSRQQAGEFEADLIVLELAPGEAGDAEAWKLIEQALTGWEPHVQSLQEPSGLLNSAKSLKSRNPATRPT